MSANKALVKVLRFCRQFGLAARTKRALPSKSKRLWLEALEDRCLLTTYTFTDPGIFPIDSISREPSSNLEQALSIPGLDLFLEKLPSLRGQPGAPSQETSFSGSRPFSQQGAVETAPASGALGTSSSTSTGRTTQAQIDYANPAFLVPANASPSIPSQRPPVGRQGPLGPAPHAQDDTLSNNVQYVAYSYKAVVPGFMGRRTLPRFNVSADAGVLVNDTPGTAGDTLIATLAGQTPPAPGGTTFGSTALGGSVTLMSDGSFSYTPPSSQSGVIDSFNYFDAETNAPNSNTARVDIYVSGDYTATTIQSGSFHMPDGDPWPKYHSDTGNSGQAPFGIYRDYPGSLAARWNTVSGGTTWVGSVAVQGAMGSTMFAEDSGGMSAYSTTDGHLLWRNTITARTLPAGQPQYPAPVIAGSVLTGTSGGSVPASLIALDINTGNLLGSFQAADKYNGSYTSTLGPVLSSPTVLNSTSSTTGTIFFGSDSAQNFGASRGRMYALRPDGSVAWLTLLAGQVHGCPVIAGNQQILVGTLPNSWTGTPGQSGSTQGRFYMLAEGTGAVQAEVFAPSNVSSSATGGSNVYFASEDGTIEAVSTTVVAPPSGKESPTLTQLWTVVGNPQPTSPALTGNQLWIGDNQGLRGLNSSTGAQLFYFTANGPVIGAPASTVYRVNSQPVGPEVAFGTNPVGGGGGTFYEVDGISGQLLSQLSFTQPILTAPAITVANIPSGSPADFYIGTSDGVTAVIHGLS